MKDRLLRLLFPPKCMLCGKLLPPEEDGVCLDCCRAVLVNMAPPRPAGPYLDKAAAGLWYEGAVRHALHGLKYQEKQSYARPLARVMAFVYQNRLEEDCDLVTFVPTNRATLRSRGYNQARLLGEELGRLLALPCADTLEKCRETAAMHGLDARQRQENVADAYRLRCDARLIEGKRILLADDILTTGSTLAACAKVLKQAGAARVTGLCAASPKKPDRD